MGIFLNLVNLYPPKESLVEFSQLSVQFTFLSIFASSMYEIEISKTSSRRGLFFRCASLIVRVEGWIYGNQNGPSIFLIFKYVNKRDELLKRACEQCKVFQNMKICLMPKAPS